MKLSVCEIHCVNCHIIRVHVRKLQTATVGEIGLY